MKKNGFTLAEVLVTLGIIGVVAALAMPALNSSVQKTKVGPTLRKFMYTIENANRMAMQEKDVDDLFDTITDQSDYIPLINSFISGGSYNSAARDFNIKIGADNQYLSSNKSASDIAGQTAQKDYVYTLSSGEEFYVDKAADVKDGQKYVFDNKEGTNYKGVGFYLYYDMNGFDNQPNLAGKDFFCFFVDRNGAVLPRGSKAAENAYKSIEEKGEESHGISTDSVTSNDPNKYCNSFSCAGAIANNNWKVGYKY